MEKPSGVRLRAIQTSSTIQPVTVTKGKASTMAPRVRKQETVVKVPSHVASYRQSMSGNRSPRVATVDRLYSLDEAFGGLDRLQRQADREAVTPAEDEPEEVVQKPRKVPTLRKPRQRTRDYWENMRKFRVPEELQYQPVREAPEKPAKRLLRKPASLRTPKPVEAASKPESGGRKYLSQFDDEVRRTKWLWDGMIPLGELSVVAGPRGAGKTQFLIDLVSKLSQGNLDGEYKGVPMESVVISMEDSESKTLKPRLIAAGFDKTKVFKLNGDSFQKGFGLSEILEKIRGVVTESPDLKLVVLDPITSLLTSRQRDHGGADLRTVLQEMSGLAHEFDLSFVCSAHIRKTASSDFLNTILGSSELANVARVVLGMDGYDRDDYGPDCVLLSQPKNNLGKKLDGGLVYKVEAAENVATDSVDGSKVSSSRIVYCGKTDRTVDDISRDKVANKVPVKSAENPCDTWLRDYLTKNGELPVKDIMNEAELENFSRRTVYRAMRNIGVVTGDGKAWREKTWKIECH